MDKNINKIIASELVARTNNVKIRQEYGTVGSSSNVVSSGLGGKAVFTTNYGIDRIVYVTINGVTQILGRDYRKISEFKIEFNGALLPGRTVNVGYMHNFNTSLIMSGTPPELKLFTVTPNSGSAGIVSFAISILENSAKNIYWEIFKEGEDVPLLNVDGESMAGTEPVVDGVAGGVSLEYLITDRLAMEEAGRPINFTVVVVYDLSEDGNSLDEKLMGTAVYRVDAVTASTLTLTVTPTTTIRLPGTYDHVVSYNVAPRGYTDIVWELTDSSGQIAASGDMSNLPTNVVENVVHTVAIGSPSVNYKLTTREAGGSIVQTETARISVSIPRPVVNGTAGYISFEMYAGGIAAPFDFIADAATFYSRGADDYITEDVPLTSSGTTIDLKTLAWPDQGLPVYGCIIIPKQSATSGIKVTDAVGSDITSTFLEIDDPTNNSWIFIKDHALAPEFPTAVAPFIIFKK